MSQISADRNLLFGIVALQMDFVDRDQLVAAMHDWVLLKSKPLGRILVEQGVLAEDTCSLLETLVKKHLSHHEDDVTKSLAAVGASSFRDELQALNDPDVQATLSHLPAKADGDDMHSAVTLVVGESTSDGQRFRRLRPHAKGGLGEVWVAEDVELRREVALKEIRQRLADNPDSRARFVMEAEITGSLEHPGIVPVYGLGQHQDGRPYYAMRLIRGKDLKEEIQQFHDKDAEPKQGWRNVGERMLEQRKLLDRFIDVCNTVEYAHSRGVIHRDIKPGNVMVGKYGETLVVDWGLAKPIGKLDSHSGTDEKTIQPASGSGSSATQMGSAVGTPQYMAPEQAAGRIDKMGPASDVYSLGATLFCLLTGQPPFTEGDVSTVLRNVQDGRFPRPCKVKPKVPRALEAICLKAMAREPADRYPSALSLAEDIERYLADEPVAAHTEPLPARFFRWVRNHRLRVALSAGMFLALAASVVAALLVIRAERETEQVSQRRRQETQQAALADERTAHRLMRLGDFDAVEQVLAKAVNQLDHDRAFAELHVRLSAKLDRARRLNQFWKLTEQAWRYHFHEYDDDAIVACDKALRQLGVFDRQRWWEHLPDDELTAAQSEKLQDEVHATLLLYATEVAKYTLPSAGLLDFARFLISEGNPELYRIAGQLCQLAEAYRPTQVGSLLELYCRFGLGDVSVTTSFSELSEYSMAKPAPDSAVDHHFMGGAHFLLHSDPTSPLSGSMRFLQTQVDLGIDFDNTAFTARQLLLAATRLSTRPYWSYLALGVALTHAGQPEDAELVYNTCITLEPNQPEGYLERARAIMQQTVDQPASAREELSQRALADLDRSLKLAPLLPAVFKTRAELFADFPDLGRRRDAIEEYHRWLERIPPLSMYRDRTSQRGLLRGCEQIEGFCQTLIKEANEEAAARELLAAAQWASGQFDAARSTIDKLSGDGIARRPRALAIRASLTLVEAVRKQPPGAALLQQALRDVEAVNSQMPAKYQAAVLRVEIMTALGRNEEALQLLNAMVEQNVAVTSWQQYDLAAHRLRALHSLGRTADAEQALQAAHEINPIAAAGLAEWFNGNR